MDYKKVVDLIDANRGKVDFGTFGSGVDDIWIEKAQKRLRVRFPPSFVWWLKNYGGGEIDGDEIFSIYEMDFDSVVGGDIVYINELYREKGRATPGELFIQKSDFGEDYYIDLNQIDDRGESPIYVAPPGVRYAEDFLHFLEKNK